MSDEQQPIVIKTTCPVHETVHVLLKDVVVHIYHEPQGTDGKWVGHMHFLCPDCVKGNVPNPEYTIEVMIHHLDQLVDNGVFAQQLGPDGKVVTGKDLMRKAIDEVSGEGYARKGAQPYKIEDAEPHPEDPPADLPPISVDDYIDFMLTLDEELAKL